MQYFKKNQFDVKKFKPTVGAISRALIEVFDANADQQTDDYSTLRVQLEKQCDRFEIAYLLAKKDKQKDILKQYNHYLQTWEKCIEEPAKTKFHIKVYHNPMSYKAVGCEKHVASTNTKAATGGVINLSIAGIIAGIAISPLNPALGIGMIAVALISLVSASGLLAGQYYPEESKLKQQESKLFLDCIGILSEQPELQNSVALSAA